MIRILLHNNESTVVLGAKSVSWSSLKGQIGTRLSCTKVRTNSDNYFVTDNIHQLDCNTSNESG